MATEVKTIIIDGVGANKIQNRSSGFYKRFEGNISTPWK
jgi:hypothetical protein